MSYPEPLTRLVDQLKRLPGIGAKSAQRLAFHILRTPRDETDRLIEAIRDVKDRVTYCSVCSNTTDIDPCVYCSSDARNRSIICVVEEPQNVTAIEKTRDYKGVYHVLMGALSPLQGIGPDELKIKSLLARVGEGQRRGDHSRHQPECRRRSDGAVPGATAQAAWRAGDAHCDGRAGRQRPGICRRGDDAQGARRSTRSIVCRRH